MAGPFDLNLRHLRAVPLIAELRSMSAAADAIGLSQPALAQGLAKLEKQFGAELFVRRPLGMTPTEGGTLVIERVRAALARLALAMRRADRTPRRGFDRADNLLTSTQVRAFLAVADAGSFIGAARATGVSQPALHRAVRELEDLADVVLAERQGRGIALTEQGKRVAGQFRLAAADLRTALEEAGSGGTGTRLAIGAMPLCRALLLPKAVAALIRAAPSSRLDIAEGSYAELIDPLRDGRIDLMIGALRDPGPADLNQQPLFVDRLMVVARGGHPLAGRRNVTAVAMSGYPWIVGRKGSPLRGHWETLFGLAETERPDAPIECGSVMAIRGILLESDFLTLLSPDQIAMELRSGLLAAIAAELPPTARTIGAITRADWRPTRLQRQFLELLGQAANREEVPEIG